MTNIRTFYIYPIFALLLFAGGCAESRLAIFAAKELRKDVARDKNYDRDRQATAPRYKVGRPYQVAGLWYYPHEDPTYDETGLASWYGDDFHGRHTANGEVFDMHALTAAHKTLPMPTKVRVTNMQNNQSVVLRVNDRGPFVQDRIIDVSKAAAERLGFLEKGTARVRVQVIASDKSRDEPRVAYRQTPDTARAGPAPVRQGPAVQKASTAPAKKPVAAAPTSVPKVTAPAPAAAANVATDVAPAQASSVTLPADFGNADDKKDGSPGTIKPIPANATSTSPITAKPAVLTAQKVQAAGTETKKVGVAASAMADRPDQFYVRAGAFSKFTNASRLQAKLDDVGETLLKNIVVKGRDLFLVLVGPYTERSEAEYVLEVVRRGGLPDAIIISKLPKVVRQ